MLTQESIILVTGCNGFLGRKLCTALVARRHSVIGICLKHPEKPLNGIVEYVVGDVCDPRIVKGVFNKYQISHVFHLAGITTHEEIVNNRFQAFRVSMLSALLLISEYVASSAEYLFYSSSGKVYKNCEQRMLSEQSPLGPNTLLGETKKQVEQCLRFHAEEDKLIVAGRIFNVYGPNQKGQFLLPTIITQLRRSRGIRLGSIDHERDYLYVDDVVTAILATTGIDKKGFFPVNIGSELGVTALDMVRAVESILGQKLFVSVASEKTRANESKKEVADSSLLRSYGWEPKWTLKQGVGSVLQQDADLTW